MIQLVFAVFPPENGMLVPFFGVPVLMSIAIFNGMIGLMKTSHLPSKPSHFPAVEPYSSPIGGLLIG